MIEVTPLNSHCIYRLEVIGKQACASCEGSPRIKIFSCELHGTCTIGKKIPEHRCCNDPVCVDFCAPTPEA